MPHQCVRCNKFYDDGSVEIIKGCSCGGKLFFFIKKEKLEETRQVTSNLNLSLADRKQVEEDVYDLVGMEAEKDKPVVLDLESIRILHPGQYELDLVHIFRGEPLIFKLEEGKYMIDLAQSFKEFKRKK